MPETQSTIRIIKRITSRPRAAIRSKSKSKTNTSNVDVKYSEGSQSTTRALIVYSSLWATTFSEYNIDVHECLYLNNEVITSNYEFIFFALVVNTFSFISVLLNEGS